MRYSIKIATALIALAAAHAPAAALNNGDFENADILSSGWQVYTSNSDDPFFGAHGSIGTDAASVYGAPIGTGENVAFLHAGRVDEYQRLWQDFSVAGAGASLTALLRWSGNDEIYYDAPYNDDGYARIAQLDGNGDPLSWTTIWDASIAEFGAYGSSPWQTASFNFSSAGNYRIEFGIRNTGIGAIGDDDDMNSSEMFVDNVVLTQPVPEPGEWAMIAAGLGVVGFAARRRRLA